MLRVHPRINVACDLYTVDYYPASKKKKKENPVICYDMDEP